jgi:hypothetical protein
MKPSKGGENRMNEDSTISRFEEIWKIAWATLGTYGKFQEGPVPHAMLVSKTNSLELLLRRNVSSRQFVRELLELALAINDGGLLDELEQELPPDGDIQHYEY